MNKRLKKVYRIYYQLHTNVWGDLHEYSKINKEKFTSSRPKLISLNIENSKASKIQSLNKYNSIQQVKKYYLNVSKKYIDQVVNNKNYFIKKYNNIINTIEMRLDSVLYRVNWCRTMRDAHQMINHGYFTINGIACNKSNLLLQRGDIVKVNSQYVNHIKDIVNSKMDSNRLNINAPEYIEVNYNTLELILLYYPENYQIPYATLSNTETFSDFLC